jgi:hypothetical protein
MAAQLDNMATWIRRKMGNAVVQGDLGEMPFKSDFGVPDYSDPMQRFLARFGRSGGGF